MKCKLEVEANECPFCDKDKMECKNKRSCSFQESGVVPEKEKYIRKERWYEKYYKNK